jgi:ribonuclease HIII
MNTSLLLEKDEIERMKCLIEEKNLKKANLTNKYELLRVKDKDLNIVLYSSGKLVHNGTDGSIKFVDAILRKEENYDYILGSDEAGKGEWFGPLVVVATALKPDDILELRKLGVMDSKDIKKPKLLKLAEKIIKMDFLRYSVIILPKTYNTRYNEFNRENKNLNDLMAWAHSKVIQELLDLINYKNAKVVIDKFDFKKTEYRLEKIDKTNLEIIQKTGGESETSVAAASIIAKYLFEQEVDKLDKKYGLKLRDSNPGDIDPELLPKVAKIHFKNVEKYLDN